MKTENKKTKIIYVNENYRVKVIDDYNYAIQKMKLIDDKNSVNYGRPEWKTKKYCSKVSQVITSLFDLNVKDKFGDIEALSNIFQEIVNFGNNLYKKCKENNV